MNKILILGTSSLQIPAILKSKELGYYVIGVDRDNYSKGKPLCDKFYCVSTMDKEKVLEIALKEEINGIFTMATDRPMATIAYVGKHINLNTDSEETIFNCTNKVQMRTVLAQNFINIPQFKVFYNFLEFESFVKSLITPCIVKSSDNSGKRGIYYLSNKKNDDEIVYAYNYAMENSNDKRILVEEIIPGNEYSVESITHNSNTQIIAITRKHNSGIPRFVEMQHTQPSELDYETERKIKDIAINAIRSLGIKNSPSHTEIITTPNGTPYIIELGARLGGDYITSHLVPLSTGYDIVKESIKCSMGLKPSLFTDEKRAALVRYFDSPAGIFLEIKNAEQIKKIPGVVLLELLKNSGDQIKKYENSGDRLGCVIIEGENINEINSTLNLVMKHIQIEVNSQ